jgi:hypothetical protein
MTVCHLRCFNFVYLNNISIDYEIVICCSSVEQYEGVRAGISYYRPLTTGLKNKLKATFEIEQCWIFAVLWRPFWKWRPVEIFRCWESIKDVEIEQCCIVVAILKMATGVGERSFPTLICG